MNASVTHDEHSSATHAGSYSAYGRAPTSRRSTRVVWRHTVSRALPISQSVGAGASSLTSPARWLALKREATLFSLRLVTDVRAVLGRLAEPFARQSGAVKSALWVRAMNQAGRKPNYRNRLLHTTIEKSHFVWTYLRPRRDCATSEAPHARQVISNPRNRAPHSGHMFGRP